MHEWTSPTNIPSVTQPNRCFGHTYPSRPVLNCAEGGNFFLPSLVLKGVDPSSYTEYSESFCAADFPFSTATRTLWQGSGHSLSGLDPQPKAGIRAKGLLSSPRKKFDLLIHIILQKLYVTNSFKFRIQTISFSIRPSTA